MLDIPPASSNICMLSSLSENRGCADGPWRKLHDLCLRPLGQPGNLRFCGGDGRAPVNTRGLASARGTGYVYSFCALPPPLEHVDGHGSLERFAPGSSQHSRSSLTVLTVALPLTAGKQRGGFLTSARSRVLLCPAALHPSETVQFVLQSVQLEVS